MPNSVFTALSSPAPVGGTVGTPKANERQRRLAEALLSSGTSGAPVGHWTQGLNRVAQALVGGMHLEQARAREEAMRQAELSRSAAGDDPLAGLKKRQAMLSALGMESGTPEAQQFLLGGSYSAPKPEKRDFGVIGEDEFGNKQYGFIGANSVTPYNAPEAPPTLPSAGGQVAGVADAVPDTTMEQGPARLGFGQGAARELGLAQAQPQVPASPQHAPAGLEKPQANPQVLQAYQSGQIPLDALSGEDFLATLPKQRADTIRAIVEGRFKFPGARALSKPYWRKVMSEAAQYEPGFDQTMFEKRVRTARNFAAGPEARNITSFNTAIGHLKTLKDATDDLNNTRVPWWNAVANFTTRQYDPDFQARLSKFEIAKQAVSEELARAFKGQAGTLTELKAWEDQLDSADSPAALNAAMTQAIELLASRIESIGDQYNQGMGTEIKGRELLSPKAQDIMHTLEGSGTKQRMRIYNPATGKLE